VEPEGPPAAAVEVEDVPADTAVEPEGPPAAAAAVEAEGALAAQAPTPTVVAPALEAPAF
jgi:hypothetical protein